MSENTDTKDQKVEKEPEAPKKQKMALWKKIVIGVVVFFVVIFAFAFFATRGAQEAADEFIADLQAGRCSEMYTRSTDEFQSLGSAEQWNEACARVSGILTGSPSQNGVGVESNSGQDQTAQATYKIAGNDGMTYVVYLELVNTGGEWKINAFDSDPEDSEEIN